MNEGGNVRHADVKTGEDGRSRGFGLVTYSSAEEAALIYARALKERLDALAADDALAPEVDDDECAICMEVLETEGDLWTCTVCEKATCSACFSRWRNARAAQELPVDCPNCRGEV